MAEERGPVAAVEAKVGTNVAQAPVAESLRRVTRVATKAKAAIAKVKQVVVVVVDAGEGQEVRPFATQESAPTSSEVGL